MSLRMSIFHEYLIPLWGLPSTQLLGRVLGIVGGGAVLKLLGDSLCYEPSIAAVAAGLSARREPSVRRIGIQA